jgi:hypothetical protein
LNAPSAPTPANRAFLGRESKRNCSWIKLPPARREKYEQSGRNSKALVKKLKCVHI